MVGTVIDLEESRNRLQLQMDDAARTVMVYEADPVTTTYHGFGTVINDKPEVFVGASGFSNLREGDRVEIRGPLRDGGVYGAQRITLLGRAVAAAPTGVGQSRDPQRDVSTPTTPRAGTYDRSGGFLEGTVRQINERDGRLVVETTTRRMVTVNTRRTTPVWYRGQQYQVTNLEVGDRVRIEADARDAQADEITATRIDVTISVQDAGTVPGGGVGGATIGVLEGRVTRVEPGLDYIYVDDGRGEVRVDMRNAEDARGDILRARDVRVGDRVEITGSMNRVGDMYLASTVRFGTSGDAGGGTGGRDTPEPTRRYGLVTLTGTVTETLEGGDTIGFRDRDTNQVVRVWVAREFSVRTNAGGYANASTLRANDSVVIQAFQDWDGNLVAQTIRLRNR
ncbi:MAG TPA: DUF5666 domain-containing protein [Thermoanaerobaculia bacterium]|jgi:hypothetical protein